MTSTHPIGLALQGGGAHGAFTWGVLDRLLEDGRCRIDAISGTSAGAMNAIALAHGWIDGGPEGARAALARFWSAVGTQVPFEWLTIGSADHPGLSPAALAWMQWTRLFSPAQLNPLGLNPLRDVLAAQIDFERLHARCPMRLYVAATNAATGRLRLFENHELSIDAALASACLPMLQQAVEIDGQPYWDGGYSANPALFPLVRAGIEDLLVVCLAPLEHPGVPRSAEEIRARAIELAFNAGYLREAQLLADACAEARTSWWPFGRLERRLRRLRTHRIDAHEDLADLPGESRLIAHLPFLERLRDLGRARTEVWLNAHGAALGRRSSADLGAP
jgi:NTE family protein